MSGVRKSHQQGSRTGPAGLGLSPPDPEAVRRKSPQGRRGEGRGVLEAAGQVQSEGAHGPAAADPTGRAKPAPLSTHRGSWAGALPGEGLGGSRGTWGGGGAPEDLPGGDCRGEEAGQELAGAATGAREATTVRQPLATPSAFTETLQPTSTHRTVLGLGKSSVTHCPRRTDWRS